MSASLLEQQNLCVTPPQQNMFGAVSHENSSYCVPATSQYALQKPFVTGREYMHPNTLKMMLSSVKADYTRVGMGDLEPILDIKINFRNLSSHHPQHSSAR